MIGTSTFGMMGGPEAVLGTTAPANSNDLDWRSPVPDQTVSDAAPAVKRCSKYGVTKSVAEFDRSKKERSGFRSECKECRRAYNVANADRLRTKRQARYQANAERLKQAQRDYFAANASVLCERQRARHARNRERDAATKRRYAQANVAKIREDNRRWQAEHREERQTYDREYRKSHAAEKRQYERKYRAAHPEWDKAKKHRRRAKKRQAGGSFTPTEWRDLCAFYGGRCLCCGATDRKLTPDHIVPLAKGGSSGITNIQPLCGSCNSSKGAKVIDYRESLAPFVAELIAANTWPNKWTGEEPTADLPYVASYADGTTQPLLPILAGGGV